MNAVRVLALAVLIFATGGCDKAQLSTAQPSDSAPSFPASSAFQLVTTKDGRLYRLNTTSGEMQLVTDSGLRSIGSDLIVLHVGEYYEMEDATSKDKFLEYLGEGRFKKSAWAAQQIQ